MRLRSALLASVGLLTAAGNRHIDQMHAYPPLREFIEKRITEFDQIPDQRKLALRQLARYIGEQQKANKPIRLTFVCTHNSRRSHMAQIAAQVAAARYEIPMVEAYSGGTESTAFNVRAVEAARCAGFQIEKTTTGENPVYHVRFLDKAPPLTCFSKAHDQAPNPRKDFCAIMVCSAADRACPNIPGAEVRIAIPYEDPKAADGTEQETRTYDERFVQITREMLYAFSLVGKP